MAEQAILTVSLKDYKKQIDDLRASLLNLESTSEEYQAIAEQIKTQQEKLNEVMGVGKKDVDAVAGSYNALTQEMSALKKEWKSLEIGSDRWVELGNQIDEINNKLKDADATVGVFGRNVGNYQQAFEGALKSTLSQLGSINPVLGKMGSTISQLIPVIKNVSKAATTGLKGIKAAIASTGIGALIVALGILTTYVTKNWDAIKDWIKGTDKAKKELENYKKALENTQKAHERYINFLKADGKSVYKVYTEELKYAIKAEENAAVNYARQIDKFGKKSKEAKEAASALTQSSDDLSTTVLDAKDAVQLLINELERSDSQKGFTQLQKDINASNKKFEDAIELVKTLGEEGKITAEKMEEYLSKLNEYQKKEEDRIRSEEAKKRWQEEEKTISSLTKTISDSFKTREQLLKEQYEKEKKLLEKHHKDTKALEAKYQNDIKRLMMETQEAINASFNQLAAANSAFTFDALTSNLELAENKLKDFIKEIGGNEKEMMPPGPPLANAIERLNQDMADLAHQKGFTSTASITELAVTWQILGRNVEAAQEALGKYSHAYEEFATAFANYDEKMSVAHVTDSAEGKLRAQIMHLEANLNEIEDVYNRMEELPELIEKASGEEKDALEKELEDIGKGIVRIGVLKHDLNKELEGLRAELANLEVESKQRVYDNKAEDANTNTDVSGFWNTTNFDEAFKARIEAEKFALDSINQLHFDSEAEREEYYREHQQRLLDIQQEYAAAIKDNWADLASGINGIFDAIGDIYEQDIANQVKHGKMTEEQAEKEYEKVQGVKIAVATIDTIQGALAAFMGYQELGQPWGTILGAVAAASVTAAGVAQIAQIASTNPYSKSSPSAASYAAATPTMTDYTPEYFTNVTGASDTEALANAIAANPIQAYVVESEVTAKQELAQERENETTF